MQTASEYLKFYFSRGLTPIPLETGGKRPILENWPNVSREEALKTFEYPKNYNIGIRIEPPFFVLDIDDRRLAPLILDEISQTWIVETKRGCHVYLKAPEGHYPTTNKKSRFIQLLAEKCQVVAPLSRVDGHEYRFRVDPSNCEIAELDENKVKLLERIIDVFAKYEAMIMEFARLWSEGHRHNLSLWLNGALRKSGIERFEAAVIVKSICLLAGDLELKDRLTALKTTYERPIEEIGAWSYLKRELESIVGPSLACEVLKLLPANVGEEHDRHEDKKFIIYTPSIVFDDVIVEGIMTSEGARFAVYHIETGEVEIIEEFERDGKIYRPIENEEVRKGVVLLSGPPLEYGTDAGLYNEVYNFLSKYHMARYDWEKKLDALYVMLTYVYDALPICPYRKMTGPKGSGKSAWLITTGYICYRPIKVSAASSDASLKRLIDRWRGTLLIDEADMSDSSIYATLVKILNVGFSSHLGLLTVCDKEDPNEIETFYVYGPKLAATRRPFEDDALESRFITTSPIKADARFFGPQFEEEAKALRSKLLLWRFRNLKKARDIALALERGLPIDWCINPRIKQILFPLYLLADSDELKKMILQVGEVLNNMVEEEEEILLKEVLNTIERGEVAPQAVSGLGGETYEVYPLISLVTAIGKELEDNERRVFAKKLSKILRANGCIVKPGAGNRRMVLLPTSLKRRDMTIVQQGS